MSEKLTSYPSFDKPWLKYYTKEEIDKPFLECKYIDYLMEKNKSNKITKGAFNNSIVRQLNEKAGGSAR